ncbi:hypothetical protein DAEQUDRAFT_731204 [Daedalea quercina L-15889]|uniref:Uncharacterized protein n=1 Tax=Daedalea quercina L-15889 TaxID=1314783 RepID=A0A165MG95_9APHY|nr:hypothetical protein DAEQUDRAFT_731204 [Daedalea quercina L-15889]
MRERVWFTTRYPTPSLGLWTAENNTPSIVPPRALGTQAKLSYSFEFPSWRTSVDELDRICGSYHLPLQTIYLRAVDTGKLHKAGEACEKAKSGSYRDRTGAVHSGRTETNGQTYVHPGCRLRTLDLTRGVLPSRGALNREPRGTTGDGYMYPYQLHGWSSSGFDASNLDSICRRRQRRLSMAQECQGMRAPGKSAGVRGRRV